MPPNAGRSQHSPRRIVVIVFVPAAAAAGCSSPGRAGRALGTPSAAAGGPAGRGVPCGRRPSPPRPCPPPPPDACGRCRGGGASNAPRAVPERAAPRPRLRWPCLECSGGEGGGAEAEEEGSEARRALRTGRRRGRGRQGGLLLTPSQEAGPRKAAAQRLLNVRVPAPPAQREPLPPRRGAPRRPSSAVCWRSQGAGLQRAVEGRRGGAATGRLEGAARQPLDARAPLQPPGCRACCCAVRGADPAASVLRGMPAPLAERPRGPPGAGGGPRGRAHRPLPPDLAGPVSLPSGSSRPCCGCGCVGALRVACQRHSTTAAWRGSGAPAVIHVRSVRERWGRGGVQEVDLRVREEGVTGEPGDWLLVSPSV